MADTAAAASPAKSPKKQTAAKPNKPSAHPKYSEMVGKAISDERDFCLCIANADLDEDTHKNKL
jgi:hypothetical protein